MYGDPVSVGDRVELHPAMDLWMRGARYGTVERASGKTSAVVRLDRTGKLRMIHLPNLRRIEG